MNDILIYILLGFLVLFSLLSVLIRNALKAVISLAAASVMLTTIMYLLGAPLAAVFELSVCAGLITVIFVSVISLTKPAADEEDVAESKNRLKRYIYLPVIVIVIAMFVLIAKPDFNFIINNNGISDSNVQNAIWNTRRLDILGQIIIILAGVLGVVILFKEGNKK
jgi:NADH-quinone oxidoreductase subunit J